MKSKWLILILILIAISFGLNHIFGLIKNKNYTPFALIDVAKGGTVDEAYCYVPSINAVRFDKPLGDWQAFEHRYDPQIQPTLGPLIFGKVAKLIGLENLYILVDFIFPPLVFLIFYYLAKLITQNELLSILASLMLTGKEPLQSFILKFGASIVKYKGLDYFFNYLNTLNRPFGFARFDTPQFSFLILVSGLVMFFKALKTKKLKYYLLTGILFGSLWYLYSYYAVFISLILFSSFIVLSLSKDWPRIKLLIPTGFVALLVSFWYWFNYLRFAKLPQASDFLHRAGQVDGRWFDTKSLFIIFFIPVLLWLKPRFKKIKAKFLFITILLLAAFFCLNLQLLTNFSVQHFHWQSVIVSPVLLLTGAFLLSLVLKPKPQPVLVVLAIALITSIFFRNLLIAKNTSTAYSKNLKLEEAFIWINQNFKSDSVIMTPSIETNYWLIIKTKAYIFNPHALHSLASTSELIDRFAITFDLFNINDDYAKDFLSYHQTLGITPYTHESLDLSGYQYIFYIQHGLKGPQTLEANQEVKRALNIFRSTKTNLKNINNQYRLDYLFVGPSEKRLSNINFDNHPNLIKVFDNRQVQIYRLFTIPQTYQ